MATIHSMDNAWRLSVSAQAADALDRYESSLLGWQLRENGAVAIARDVFGNDELSFKPGNSDLQRAIFDANDMGLDVSSRTIAGSLGLSQEQENGLRMIALAAPAVANASDLRAQFSTTFRLWQTTRARVRATRNAAQIAESLASGDAPPLDLLKSLSDDAATLRVRGRARGPLSKPLGEFLAATLPERQTLLAPWLTTGGLAMVHAWRGVGKTHFALSAAMAVATGADFLKWHCERPVKVLYVDGEMPGRAMQDRLRDAVAMFPMIPDPDNFRLITPDQLPDDIGVPNLVTHEGQALIEHDLEGRELVIFDNIATLFRTEEDTNSTASWMAAQDYILCLRRRGMAVLLVDHDNKTGGNRGTSAKADVLDTIIQLRQPADYVASQGCRFEVHFTKHRGFFGKDANTFEAALGTDQMGCPAWTICDGEEAELRRYADLHESGLKDRDIREEMGIGGSRLGRLKRDYQNRVGQNAA